MAAFARAGEELRPVTGAGPSRPGTSSGSRRHVTSSALESDLGPHIESANSNRSLMEQEVEKDDFLRIMNYDRFHRDNFALICAEKGDLEGLRKLIAEDPSVIACKGLKGYTLLHHAAGKGFGTIISELLKHGLEVNSRNEDLETPLHLSVYGGHILAVDQLLDYGADINAVNGANETCLFYAVQRSMPAIIRLLVLRGVDQQIRDQDGDLAKDHSTQPHILRALQETAVAPSSAGAFSSGQGSNDRIAYDNLLRVFSYLSVPELSRAACVCTKWHRVCENTSLWKALGVRRWEVALQSSLGFGPTATSSLFNPKRTASFQKQKKGGEGGNSV